MTLLRVIVSELIALFVDDGALALFILVLVALASLLALWGGVPAGFIAIILVAGYGAILAESTMRFARAKRAKRHAS
jgi:hypothetical protein